VEGGSSITVGVDGYFRNLCDWAALQPSSRCKKNCNCEENKPIHQICQQTCNSYPYENNDHANNNLARSTGTLKEECQDDLCPTVAIGDTLISLCEYASEIPARCQETHFETLVSESCPKTCGACGACDCEDDPKCLSIGIGNELVPLCEYAAIDPSRHCQDTYNNTLVSKICRKTCSDCACSPSSPPSPVSCPGCSLQPSPQPSVPLSSPPTISGTSPPSPVSCPGCSLPPSPPPSTPLSSPPTSYTCSNKFCDKVRKNQKHCEENSPTGLLYSNHCRKTCKHLIPGCKIRRLRTTDLDDACAWVRESPIERCVLTQKSTGTLYFELCQASCGFFSWDLRATLKVRGDGEDCEDCDESPDEPYSYSYFYW